MKRLLQLFILIIPFFYMSQGFSWSREESEAFELSQHRRIYVMPDQLRINSDGFFINVDNHWIKAEALFSDETGIFIQRLLPHANGCREGYVPCRNCDRCVKEIYNICPHCERPV